MKIGSLRVSWRLVGAVLAAAALVTAALIFLPSGATRLLILFFLALPAMFFLVSKPEYILAIILFMRFTNFDIFLPMRLFKPLILLLVVSLVAVWLDGRKFEVKDRMLMTLIIAFVLIAFQSMAVAEDLLQSTHSFESLVGVLLVIAAVLLLTVSRGKFLAFLILVTVATMISNFLPLIIPPPGDYASKSLIWGEGVMRFEGYQMEANIFAFHQIFIIPVLLFLLTRFDRPRLARPLILAALAGTVFVLMLSFSRGGFVGLIVILAALLVVERKNKAVMTIAIAGVIILLVAAPTLYWNRITSLIEAAKQVSQDHAILVRVRTMKVALVLGFENPFFGVGIGNFIYQSARFLPFTKVVHNAFLQIFSELGLPGMAVVSTIFIRNIIIIRSMMQSKADIERAHLGRFLMVQQAAVALSAMFIPIGYEFIFWIWLVIPSLANQAYSGKTGKPERL